MDERIDMLEDKFEHDSWSIISPEGIANGIVRKIFSLRDFLSAVADGFRQVREYAAAAFADARQRADEVHRPQNNRSGQRGQRQKPADKPTEPTQATASNGQSGNRRRRRPSRRRKPASAQQTSAQQSVPQSVATPENGAK